MTNEPNESASASPKRKKTAIVVGVVAAIVVVAGAGFFVWHEQPSFCNAICHTPMDEYYATWEDGSYDRYGNEIEDANGMMSYLHAGYSTDGSEVEHGQGIACLDCHVPTITEQVTEGIGWVTGNYYYPLEEHTLADLTEARGVEARQFCTNDTCHSDLQTDEALAASTESLSESRNPHDWSEHGDVECSTCHKAHSQSVNSCSECHDDAPIPDGWLSVSEKDELPGL